MKLIIHNHMFVYVKKPFVIKIVIIKKKIINVVHKNVQVVLIK